MPVQLYDSYQLLTKLGYQEKEICSMTILAIIKGSGREAIDACIKRQIVARFVREDAFGSTHVEIEDRFSTQISKWYMEDVRCEGSGHPTGTLLFFTKSKTEA